MLVSRQINCGEERVVRGGRRPNNQNLLEMCRVYRTKRNQSISQ